MYVRVSGRVKVRVRVRVRVAYIYNIYYIVRQVCNLK